MAKTNRRRSSPLATEHHTEKPWEHYRTRELLKHHRARNAAVAFDEPGEGPWSGKTSRIVALTGWDTASAADAYRIAFPYSGTKGYAWEFIDWTSHGSSMPHGSSMEGYQVLALPTDVVEGLNHLSQERGLTIAEFLRQVVERAAAGLPYAGIVDDEDEELSLKVEEVLARLKK